MKSARAENHTSLSAKPGKLALRPLGLGTTNNRAPEISFVFGPCAATVLFAKVRLIDTEPDEADDPRPPPIELAFEDRAPFVDLGRRELGGGTRRSRGEVGERNSEFR